MNIPHIHYRNISNEKDGSTLSASYQKDEINFNKIGKKNVSFMNPLETKFLDIKDNDINLNNNNTLFSINKNNKNFEKNQEYEKDKNINIKILNESF